MVKIPFLLTEAVFTLIWFLVRAIICIRKKRIDWKRELLYLLMYVNFAVILRFTFFPMGLADGKVQPLVFDTADARFFGINFVPFVNIASYDSKAEMLLNIIGNTALFIPSGILLPICCKKLNRFWKVLCAGVLLSLCIEILQLPFARLSDVDDLILNTLGVAAGYGIYALIRMIRRKRHGI